MGYWCCRSKDKDACSARATTDDHYVLFWTGIHNHPPNLQPSDRIL